jgi:hypothetical protein
VHLNLRLWCRCFSQEVVQGLIRALEKSDYRVQTLLLSVLCNLSATPVQLSPVFGHVRERDPLLEAIERVLMQTRMDAEAQSAATQLMLNLTAPFVLQGPVPGLCQSSTHDSTADELIVDSAKDTATGALTHFSTKSHPSKHSENTATMSSRLTVRSLPTECLTKDTLDGVPGDALNATARALLNVALRVLRDAPYLDRESRENCIEVFLALLHVPTSACGLDRQVVRFLPPSHLFGVTHAFAAPKVDGFSPMLSVLIVKHC